MNLFQWVVATVGLAAFAWHERHVVWTPQRVAGAVICLVTFLLVSLARYQLGRSFSVSAQARRLVTTGLYARIRNPIYIFAELFLVGLAMFLRSWVIAGLALGAAAVQMVRARKEAAVLEGAFGDEYRSYYARTWF